MRWVYMLAGSAVVYVACSAGSAASRLSRSDAGAGAAGMAGGSGKVGAGGSGGGAAGAGGVPFDAPADVLADQGDDGADGQGGVAGSGGGATDAGEDALADVLDALTDPVPDAAASTSGTRLRARWLVGDDGSRQFAGWWDSLLGVECSVVTTSDGAQRCAPWVNNAGCGASYFSDAACTQAAAGPLGSGVTCCTEWIMVSESLAGACGDWPAARTTYHRRGVELAAGTPLYRLQATTGACLAVTSPIPGTYYAANPVDPATFVRFTEQTD